VIGRRYACDAAAADDDAGMGRKGHKGEKASRRLKV
jgi:hypothetical protein